MLKATKVMSLLLIITLNKLNVPYLFYGLKKFALFVYHGDITSVQVQECVIYHYCFYVYELLTCFSSYPKLFPRILMATSRNLLMKMEYLKK